MKQVCLLTIVALGVALAACSVDKAPMGRDESSRGATQSMDWQQQPGWNLLSTPRVGATMSAPISNFLDGTISNIAVQCEAPDEVVLVTFSNLKTEEINQIAYPLGGPENIDRAIASGDLRKDVGRTRKDAMVSFSHGQNAISQDRNSICRSFWDPALTGDMYYSSECQGIIPDRGIVFGFNLPGCFINSEGKVVEAVREAVTMTVGRGHNPANGKNRSALLADALY